MTAKSVRRISREEMLNYEAILMNHPLPWRLVHSHAWEVIDKNDVRVVTCDSQAEGESFITDVPTLRWKHELTTACDALGVPDDVVTYIESLFYDDAFLALLRWLEQDGREAPVQLLHEAGVRYAFSARTND